jgi:redox-sensitive bicupin YhaK (pirin superfamily)
MLTVRASSERGRSQLDWLDSRHTFSFDQYYDPSHMSYGPLRVINEDYIAPGKGFGTHPHRDMEIITYVVEGQLRHQDSLGTGSVISAGEIQKMSAGSGIMHSEFNASKDKGVHLLQIWITPKERNLSPRYEQEAFSLLPGEWKLLGSPDGDGLVSIHQDVRLYALRLDSGMKSQRTTRDSARVWLQIVKGACTVNGTVVNAGDGLALSSDSNLEIVATEPTELLAFEFSSN